MELTEAAIAEFEKLWRQDHPGETLTRERLIAMATRVLFAFQIVYREIPKDKAEIFERIKLDQKRRES